MKNTKPKIKSMSDQSDSSESRLGNDNLSLRSHINNGNMLYRNNSTRNDSISVDKHLNGSNEASKKSNPPNTDTASQEFSLKDSFIDLYMSISPKTGFTFQNVRSSFVRPGEWIVSNPTTSSELFHGVHGYMNSLNEWDPNKLGWFRALSKTDYRSSSILRHTPTEILQKYLLINVQNCKQQVFKAAFHGITSESTLPLHPLHSSLFNNNRRELSQQQQYKYRIRKSTKILSMTPDAYHSNTNKLNVNLAVVANGGPFKLYPSAKESMFAKMYIDSSFNATIEMDKDRNTWLLLNIGRTCGGFLSGDIRYQDYKSILTRLD